MGLGGQWEASLNLETERWEAPSASGTEQCVWGNTAEPAGPWGLNRSSHSHGRPCTPRRGEAGLTVLPGMTGSFWWLVLLLTCDTSVQVFHFFLSQFW